MFVPSDTHGWIKDQQNGSESQRQRIFKRQINKRRARQLQLRQTRDIENSKKAGLQMMNDYTRKLNSITVLQSSM